MAPVTKLRVLTISKPYVARAYRDKLLWWRSGEQIEPGLICPPAWGSQAFEPDGVLETNLYHSECVPVILNGRNHFHIYRGLESAIRRFRPDILNVEEEHYSLVTYQCFRLARKLGVPAIFYTWQNIHKRYPPPFSWIESYIFRNAAGGVAGNQEAADILRAKGYHGTLRVIPQMGVSYERFAPQIPGTKGRDDAKRSVGLDPTKFWILFAGRIVPEKGIDTLVAALRDGLPGRAAVAVVGSGPALPELRRRASDLECEGQIAFRPQVPSDQIANYLRAADVLCLPSLTRGNWKEQFGRVLVEAMAAEAIVVGSSSGEIPKVIGGAGLVFQEGQPSDLREKLGTLISDQSLCERLRSAGRDRVLKNFTNEVVAKKFADLFMEIKSSKLSLTKLEDS